VIELPADRSPRARSVLRLGGRVAEQARDVLEGRKEAAEPRDAATVMLLRPASPGQDAIQVYMLRRAASMAFGPGAYVFPGGSVDPRDTGGEVAWAGPDAAQWGAVLAAPPDLARALVCAAVRETFEESGVLLAGPSPDQVVADTRGEDWEADRRALLDRSLSLADLLGRRRLVLRADLLRPWARWITPITEARRYDTRFFAAALPAGQRTRDVGGEADQVAWVEPGEAIGAARRGEIQLMPPTAVTLAELGACRGVTGALGERRRITAVIPEVVLSEGAVWLTVPAELEYPL
jgi:8-oxo-dGTP pyrophosphatase MutT (NUDIX family)